MKNIKNFLLFICSILVVSSNAQNFNLSINCDSNIGTITPLWNDYWELNVEHGYGPHPCIFQNIPHTPFIEDVGFVETMKFLKPRSIKVSIGTFVYLPHISYASEDTSILKNLTTEFYRGGNTISEADNPDNYYFEYLDSQLDALDSIGVDIFLNIDYMPFTLSSNQNPHYFFGCPIPFYQIDNTIRTVPPKNNEVYARVVRNIIRHTKGLFKGNKDYGINYYEIWNEPDHPFNNLIPTFWRGNEYQLFDMYQAIINEIDNDIEIANSLNIGCCSFAILNADQEEFTENFLKEVSVNNTRLDFLSVHPYSSDPMGSLDTLKLSFAQQMIDSYAPNAELVNTEWGIISGNVDFVNSLEHELLNFRDVSLMLDRNTRFAHYVNLVEYSTDNLKNIGVCYNSPIRPKINAVARVNMNKLLDTPNRLKVQGVGENYVVAGINEDNSKIIITTAAPKSQANESGMISIEIQNIPFSNEYQVKIFEFSETDFDNGEYFKIINEFSDTSETLLLELNYEIDQNSGRLYTIEIEGISTSNIKQFYSKTQPLKIHPNPSDNILTIESNHTMDLKVEEINIYTITGKNVLNQLMNPTDQANIDISILQKGLYILNVKTKSDEIALKFIKN